jgi:hypothetical protein
MLPKTFKKVMCIRIKCVFIDNIEKWLEYDKNNLTLKKNPNPTAPHKGEVATY